MLAKHLADRFLTERVPLLGDLVGLVPLSNAGIAFGIRLPAIVQTLLITVALLLVLHLGMQRRRSRIEQVSFGLILGGALGNLLDRVPDGMVTDFFQVSSFYIFNVADCCITVGVALLVLDQVIQWWKHRRIHIAP
jgi:signal peptidase II